MEYLLSHCTITTYLKITYDGLVIVHKWTLSLVSKYLFRGAESFLLTGLAQVKKFTAFHGTRMFIIALTSVRHLSLSWASPIQSIYPLPTSGRSILILSTHLCLGLPSSLLHPGFLSKTLYTSISSPIRATCPAYLILLDFITRAILGEKYKSFCSSLCNLLHSPVTSSLLGSNILLNTIFSNTLSFLSSRNVNDQVSHPYKTTGKIVVLYILSPEQASCLQVFLNMNVLQGGVVSTSPNPQAGGPPLVRYPRLLIQFIRSYPPYRSRSSIRNLRTRHAVVTGTHYMG